MSLTECEPPAPVSVFLSLKNFHSSHEGSRRERKSRSTRRNSLTLPPTIDEEPLSVEDVEVRFSAGRITRFGWGQHALIQLLSQPPRAGSSPGRAG